MSGSSVMPAGSKRMLVNALTKAGRGTPYCRPWLTEMAKASMMPARVEPCFETLMNTSPGRPSSYSPTVTKPLQSATRNSKVRLVRDGTVVYDGEIASLRRFNDDVREVTAGFDCGIVLRDFADIKEGDVLETYATRQVERVLV